MTTCLPLPARKRPLSGIGLILTALLAFLAWGGLDADQARADADTMAYARARQHFQSVAENRKKSALRANWERVEQEFAALYKANPKVPLVELGVKGSICFVPSAKPLVAIQKTRQTARKNDTVNLFSLAEL